MTPEEMKGASFSICRTYRYALWRKWDAAKPMVMFIGLNPSTANEASDDPTIRRVISFAKTWGYGGVYMLNLFAIVSPYPEVLITASNPLGNNDAYLSEFGSISKDIVFAWGSFKEAKDRANKVSAMFPNAKALHVNKDGSPKHPLYVKGDTIPVPFKTN
jgi:hypothetical protein